MRYFFTLTSSNAKTGNIPQVYAQRSTCPPSCIHYDTASTHTRTCTISHAEANIMCP